jgi:hypothetical protein
MFCDAFKIDERSWFKEKEWISYARSCSIEAILAAFFFYFEDLARILGPFFWPEESIPLRGMLII